MLQPSRRPWSAEETEALKKMYGIGTPIPEMCKVLKSRTYLAISRKIEQLVKAGELEKRAFKPEVDYDMLQDVLSRRVV